MVSALALMRYSRRRAMSVAIVAGVRKDERLRQARLMAMPRGPVGSEAVRRR